MHAIVCSRQGVLETLGNELKQLDEEIKADESGKQEFERQLAQVRSVLGKRTAKCICFLAH